MSLPIRDGPDWPTIIERQSAENVLATRVASYSSAQVRERAKLSIDNRSRDTGRDINRHGWYAEKRREREIERET